MALKKYFVGIDYIDGNDCLSFEESKNGNIVLADDVQKLEDENKQVRKEYLTIKTKYEFMRSDRLFYAVIWLTCISFSLGIALLMSIMRG